MMPHPASPSASLSSPTHTSSFPTSSSLSSSSSSSSQFPESVLKLIRQFDGNTRCCDCTSTDTDWASVSHGILLCISCAGKHRNLGVNISYVKSIHMDSWSERQLEIMKQGGNGQLKSFFAQLKLGNSPISSLYVTKGAYIYRKLLIEKIDSIFASNNKGDSANYGEGSQNGTYVSHFDDHYSSSPGSPYKNLKIEDKMVYGKGEYVIEFDKNSLGMTLEKNSENEAVVTRVVPGSSAALKGVRVGDTAIAVMGKYIDEYDDIMHMIMCVPRPMQVAFRRQGSSSPRPLSVFQEQLESLSISSLETGLDASANGSLISSDNISNSSSNNNSNSRDNSFSAPSSVFDVSIVNNSSVDCSRRLEACEEDDSLSLFAGLTIRENENDDPIDSNEAYKRNNDANIDQSLTYTVSFPSPPLGLTLDVEEGDSGRAVVTGVKPDGPAHCLGVMASDILESISNSLITSYDDAMVRLSPDRVRFPLELTFKRPLLSSSSSSNSNNSNNSSNSECDNNNAHKYNSVNK